MVSAFFTPKRSINENITTKAQTEKKITDYVTRNHQPKPPKYIDLKDIKEIKREKNGTFSLEELKLPELKPISKQQVNSNMQVP